MRATSAKTAIVVATKAVSAIVCSWVGFGFSDPLSKQPEKTPTRRVDRLLTGAARLLMSPVSARYAPPGKRDGWTREGRWAAPLKGAAPPWGGPPPPPTLW